MNNLGEHSGLTAMEIDIIVQKSVRETFKTLGVDLSDTRDVRELQADFRYMRDQRMGGARMGEYVKKSVITTFLGGALWALWYGLQFALRAKT